MASSTTPSIKARPIPATVPGMFGAHHVDFGGDDRLRLHGNEAHHLTGRIETSQHRQAFIRRDVAFDRGRYAKPLREGFEHFPADSPAPIVDRNQVPTPHVVFGECPESALCSGWPTTRRMGEDAPFRPLAQSKQSAYQKAL